MTALIALLLPCMLLDADEGQANEKAAKSAILASQNNAAQFVRYFCRWKETRATSKTLEEAFSGKYENQRSCEYTLAHDGKSGLKDKFQCYAPPIDKKSGVRDGDRIVITAEFLKNTELRRGEESLFLIMNSWNDARYRLRQHWNIRHESMPLSMGDFYGDLDVNSPFTMLNEIQHKKATLSTTGNTSVNGVSVIQAKFRRKNSDWIFFFDATRGYLPYQAENVVMGGAGKEKLRHVARLLEAKECEGKRWFPMKVVCAWLPAAEGEPINLSEIKVLELRLDKEVKQEDFEVVLPAGMTILQDEPQDAVAKFKLQKIETISPDDIPRIGQLIVEAREKQKSAQTGERPLMDTSITGLASPVLNWLLIVVGSIIFSGAVLMIYRRSRFGT